MRGSQLGIAGLMEQRARGLVPSIAQMQADRQMQQAAAEQSSAAASARGPAGLALAQQGAAANTAAMQSNISGQAQVNAAIERERAEQAAFGAFSGVRGQDSDAAQKQAALNAAQRAANDQYSMGLYGHGVDVNKAQLGAQGNKIGILTGQDQGNRNRDSAEGMHDDNRTDKYIGYGLGAAGTIAGIGAMFFGSGGGGDPAEHGSGTGAGGYGGNAPADGSLDPATSGGEYGGGTYDVDPYSDIRAKRDIQPLGGLMQSAGVQHNALMGMGPAVGRGDPVTAQFAQGLAPSSYDFKPGFGETGHKVGPMAQNMAASPVTAPAVHQDPRSGLLAIDKNDGLRVSLAASGHLAAKQQETDKEIARLKAQLAASMGDTAAQQQGLMAQGPSVGQDYLDTVRGGR